MGERYKRNYFNWAVPISFIGIITTILAIAKKITYQDLSLYTFAYGILLIVLWHSAAHLFTAFDLRAKRYFDAYDLLLDFKTNKDYERMKKEFLEPSN